MPFVVLCRKPELIEMPKDACHCHGAVAPWWTKVEIEIVVLYIWIAGNASLHTREPGIITSDLESTYRSYLPSTQMLSHRFGNGWLLSNAEDLTCHAVFSFELLHDASGQLLPSFQSLCSIIEAEQFEEYEYAERRMNEPLSEPRLRLVPKKLDPAARIDKEFLMH